MSLKKFENQREEADDHHGTGPLSYTALDQKLTGENGLGYVDALIEVEVVAVRALRHIGLYMEGV